MPDYSDPNTPLTANGYTWTATLATAPLRPGVNPSDDLTGSCTPAPGDTVATLLDTIRAIYAEMRGADVEQVVLARYSLHEK